ncbi:MAG: M17 family peptidase N-terminal domain-containing protein [Bdellovibrionota bacterium]
MNYEFIKIDHIDYIEDHETDLFVTCIFQDQKPPHGLAAKMDWRMGSWISKNMVSGLITGEFEEKTLIALSPKFKAPRALLVGFGDSNKLTFSNIKKLVEDILDNIEKIQAERVSLHLPVQIYRSAPEQMEELLITLCTQRFHRKPIRINWINALD